MNTPTDMRSGTIHSTYKSGRLEIIDYISASKVTIKFIGYEHAQQTQAFHIRKGNVRNKMLPCVLGVGFTGVGDYSKTNDSLAYTAWNNMLKRCYCDKFQEKNPTYAGCLVTKEWHSFQGFAAWFYDNYQDGQQLDKDILVQGNKTYSPETSLFVTSKINLLFMDNRKNRGLYPQGVNFKIESGKFESSLSVENKKVHLGYFESPELAFEVYCKQKYAHIKKIALDQPEPLKSALLAYRIK